MNITSTLSVVPDSYHGWRVIQLLDGKTREGLDKTREHVTYHATLAHALVFCLDRALLSEPVAQTLQELLDEIRVATASIEAAAIRAVPEGHQ